MRYGFNQRNRLITNTAYMDGTGWALQAEYRYDGNNDRLQQIAYGSGTPITTTYTNDIIGLAKDLIDPLQERLYNAVKDTAFIQKLQQEARDNPGASLLAMIVADTAYDGYQAARNLGFSDDQIGAIVDNLTPYRSIHIEIGNLADEANPRLGLKPATRYAERKLPYKPNTIKTKTNDMGIVNYKGQDDASDLGIMAIVDDGYILSNPVTTQAHEKKFNF